LPSNQYTFKHRSDLFAIVHSPNAESAHFLTKGSATIMTRLRISSGSTFEEQIGYSRAIVQDNWVFVSGTTGFDYHTMTISSDVVTQADQCFKNIAAALAQAGSSLADVVRVTYVLPDATEFEACWPVLRQYLGETRPAAMMISAGLADPRMKIEIEVTAIKNSK
jgi:enamine deaminase RidA (YjgF/YER057c/UK114 family)